MTDCPRADVRDLLPDLLNDRLDPRTRAEVEQHVASCADCSREMTLLRELHPVLSRTPAVDVTRIASAVRASRAPKAPLRARAVTRAWLQLAAAIALLLGGGAGLLLWSRAQYAPAPRTVAVVDSVPDTDSQPIVSTDQPPDTAAVARTPAPKEAARVASAQGIVFGGGVGDLADADLEALLGDLERLDALTDVEPESVLPDVGEGL